MFKHAGRTAGTTAADGPLGALSAVSPSRDMTKLVASTVVALSAVVGGAALRYTQKGAAPPTASAATAARPAASPGRHPAAAEAKPRRDLAPAHAPSVPKRLPDEYQIVERRSIFGAGGPAAAPAGQTARAPADGAFTLKGIAQRGREFVAFIERPGANSVSELHVQNPLGRGRVVAITLQSLDFEADGRVTRVEVGQTIGAAAPPPAAAPIAASPLAISSVAPSAVVAPSPVAAAPVAAPAASPATPPSAAALAAVVQPPPVAQGAPAVQAAPARAELAADARPRARR